MYGVHFVLLLFGQLPAPSQLTAGDSAPPVHIAGLH
jgi:hypothetical protein